LMPPPRLRTRKSYRPKLACCKGPVDVRFGSEADIPLIPSDVRFTPKCGHSAVPSIHNRGCHTIPAALAMNYDRRVIRAILLASATAVTLGKQVRSAIQSATKIATQLLTGSQGKLRRCERHARGRDPNFYATDLKRVFPQAGWGVGGNTYRFVPPASLPRDATAIGQ